MTSKPNFHKLAKAHLIGLCSVFKVTTIPRLYTKRWPKAFGDVMAMAVDDSNSIYINLERHKNVSQVYDSVAHELAHLMTAWEDKAHGKHWRDTATQLGADTKYG